MKCNASPCPSRYLAAGDVEGQRRPRERRPVPLRHGRVACRRCWRPVRPWRLRQRSETARMGRTRRPGSEPACGVNTAGRCEAGVNATGSGGPSSLLDEVAHRTVERGGDLEQRGDRGNHVVPLDLVDRRCRHFGLARQLLKRECAAPGAGCFTFGPIELTIPSTCSSMSDRAGGRSWSWSCHLGPLDALSGMQYSKRKSIMVGGRASAGLLASGRGGSGGAQDRNRRRRRGRDGRGGRRQGRRSRSARSMVYTEFDDVAYSPCGIPYVHGKEIDDFRAAVPCLQSRPTSMPGIDVRYNADVDSRRCRSQGRPRRW